jgi:hypothetical protein
MRRNCSHLAASAGFAALLFGASPASAQTAPSLGSAQRFVLLGGTTIANSGPSVVTGDVGVSPGVLMTGFPPGSIVSGQAPGAVVSLAGQNSVTAAYDNLLSQTCTEDLSGQDLGGKTLTAGVYCFSGSALLTGTLTLNGLGNPNPVFIFKIVGTLTTANGSSVVLVNGGSTCNVFWQVGGSAMLGTTTAFAGNILAMSNITMTSGASLTGRVLARTGAVMLDTNIVTPAACTVLPTPPQPFVVSLNVSAPAARASATRIAWTAVPTATSYTVKRGLAPGQESVLATGITTTTFTDSSTTQGRRYYYVVTAVNSFGESTASYEVSITPGRARDGDFVGDGKSDTTVFRPSTGIWYTRASSTGTLAFSQWGMSGDVPVPGDYDGDGKTDIAVFRPSTGIWYVVNSSTGTEGFFQWGLSGDVPVPGDYDGDGKTDIAVFRPSTGIWYIVYSSTGKAAFFQWGLNDDVPVPGDYDGDGKTDVAVFRPSTGIWYVVDSSTGTPAFFQWGVNGDVPVPADYDGDGKTDIAVFRPATGFWYVVNSSTGTPGFFQWGLSGDVPVPGDYDGDGKTDIAVFRPSTGIWYIVSSSTGTPAFFQWGLDADIPILKR